MEDPWPRSVSLAGLQAFERSGVCGEARRLRRPLRPSASSRRRAVSDEKIQIQAVNRTQPGLPMKKGRAGTMTHALQAQRHDDAVCALNTLIGEVFARNMQRHRHQEFIRFLNALELDIPAGKVIHAILDNCNDKRIGPKLYSIWRFSLAQCHLVPLAINMSYEGAKEFL